MRQRAYVIIYLGISLTIFAPTSCTKDARCDCAADTLKIARIFQPDSSVGKDAVIESITPDQNYGNATFLAAFSWTSNGAFNTARSLLQFDLSSIPAQTDIKKAVLSLYWKPFGNLIDQTGENAFTIYRITQAWSETAVTWNNQPSISSSDSVTVSKSIATNQSYKNIDVTNLVQDMINDPFNSYGFMLHLETEFPYRLVVLASCKDADANKHPKLEVSY